MLGLLGWWLCCLLWIATVDWICRDSIRYRISPSGWVLGSAVPFFLLALAAWWIPSSLAVFLLLPLAWLVPAIAYVVHRNGRLPAGRRVLTAAHLRRVASRWLAPLGVKIDPGVEDDEPLPPSVELAAPADADPAGVAEWQKKLAALPGVRPLRELLAAALLARATRLRLQPEGDGVGVGHEVDGLWERRRMRAPPAERGGRDRYPVAPPLGKDEGLAVVAALKEASGLSAEGGGTLQVSIDGKRQALRVAGTKSQFVVELPVSPMAWKALADIGMTDPVLTSVTDSLKVDQGLLLVGGPTNSGLTTTFDMMVQSADRLLRDFVSIEDEAAPARAIQNVKPMRFDARKKVAPTDALTTAMREYPQVLITRDIRDKDLLLEMIRLAGDGLLVMISLKANDAVDAVQRLLQVGVDPAVLSRVLLGAVSQRVVRRLCPRCRVAEKPSPELLTRMRRTPEQAPQVWRANPDGCGICQGTGYLGRTGLFEFAPGARLRPGVADRAATPNLKDLAVKGGMVPLPQAGFDLAVAGVTSLQEVQRVLTPAAAKPAAGASKR